MGLFDFITKTPSNNSKTQQGNANNSNQGYQTTYQQDDRLVQSPFSDVKYPLPDGEQNIPQGQQYTTPAQFTPDMHSQQDIVEQGYSQPPNNQYGTQDYYNQPYSQQVQEPTLDYSNYQNPTAYQQTQVLETDQTEQQSQPTLPLANTASQQSEESGSEFLQYNPQFQTPTVESQTQNIQADEVNQSFQSTEESNTNFNQTITPISEPGLESAPIQDNQQQAGENVVSESVNPSAQVQSNLAQPMGEITSQADLTKEGSKDEAINNTLVIGTDKDASVEQINSEVNNNDIFESDVERPSIKEVLSSAETGENIKEPVAELPPLPEPKLHQVSAESTEPLSTETTTDLKTEIPVVESLTHESSELQNDMVEAGEKVVVGGPVGEIDIDKQIFNNIEEAVKSENNDEPGPLNEVSEVETQENIPTVNSIEKESDNSLKVFKNIGVVGLNVDAPVQNISEKLMELTRLLSVYKVNFVLDSGRGYGENLLNKLLERKDINITGAFLKPFYSDYSDEPKARINTDNYSTAVFSNLDLKLKYLIRSSDIFIIPETKGIANISLLFALLSNSYLYFGQHKPIILFGEGWNDVVNNLKTTLKLNEVESELFIVCENASDVVALLQKLDKEYSVKSRVNVGKVIDMRNESDEAEYFVNNV